MKILDQFKAEHRQRYTPSGIPTATMKEIQSQLKPLTNKTVYNKLPQVEWIDTKRTQPKPKEKVELIQHDAQEPQTPQPKQRNLNQTIRNLLHKQ